MFERWFKCWNPWNPWNFGCGNFFRAKLPNWKAPKILRSKSAKSLRNMAMEDPRNLHSVRGFPSHVWWNQRLPGSQLCSAKRWHCGGTSCVSLVDHLRQQKNASLQDAEKTANELTDMELGIVWSELRRGLTFCIKVSSTLMAAETSLRSPTGALFVGPLGNGTS